MSPQNFLKALFSLSFIVLMSCASNMNMYVQKSIYESDKEEFEQRIDSLKTGINTNTLDARIKSLEADNTKITDRLQLLEDHTKELKKEIAYLSLYWKSSIDAVSVDTFEKQIDTVSTYEEQLKLQYGFFLGNANEKLRKAKDDASRLSSLRQLAKTAFGITNYSFNSNVYPGYLGNLVSIDSYDENLVSVGLGLGISVVSISGPSIGLLVSHQTKHFFKNSEIDAYFTVTTSKLYFLGYEIYSNLPILITAYSDGRQTINSFLPIVPFEKLQKHYDNIVGPDGYKIYSVQSGDNIYSICKFFYGDKADDVYVKISEINAIYPPKNNRIFPGQELIIPKNLELLDKMYRSR